MLPTKNINKGFTLVEILITLSIAAVIITFSYFFYSGYLASIKLNAAAIQISSDLRSSQNSAKIEQITYTVEFFPDYYLINDKKEIQLPSGVTAEPKVFKFADSGFPPPGYSGTLTLYCQDKTRKVIVSSVGRIRTE